MLDNFNTEKYIVQRGQEVTKQYVVVSDKAERRMCCIRSSWLDGNSFCYPPDDSFPTNAKLNEIIIQTEDPHLHGRGLNFIEFTIRQVLDVNDILL